MVQAQPFLEKGMEQNHTTQLHQSKATKQHTNIEKDTFFPLSYFSTGFFLDI
jgi:hypothetical protein